MTTDLTERLKKFYKLGERDQQATLSEILEIANENPEQFIQDLQEKEFGEFSNLPIIYEALSRDLKNWSNFFLSEIKRLFELARKSPIPDKILNHVKEFSFIKADQFEHRNEFVNILKKELNNQHPTFRYYAIYLLLDFMKEDDVMTIRKLKEHLKDSDWRIRYLTYQTLKDLHKLDNGETLSLADRIRAKYKNTSGFE